MLDSQWKIWEVTVRGQRFVWHIIPVKLQIDVTGQIKQTRYSIMVLICNLKSCWLGDFVTSRQGWASCLPMSTLCFIFNGQTSEWYRSPCLTLYNKVHFPICQTTPRAHELRTCCYYDFTSPYGEGWPKNGENIKKSSASLASIHFLLCLDIKSIKDPVQEWISSPRPRQNPVSVSLQRTGPGGNVSLLWLHIKIQKGFF